MPFNNEFLIYIWLINFLRHTLKYNIDLQSNTLPTELFRLSIVELYREDRVKQTGMTAESLH